MTLVYLYFALCCVVVAAAVGWGVWRRWIFVRDSHSRRLAALWTLSGSDPLAEAGVSLLVDFDCSERIEALLSLDYVRYEVVVMGDISKSKELRSLLRRYSMIDVGAPVIEPQLQRTSRRLYRSRENRFRRLVVVDTIAPSAAERFDSALAVRSYDLVVPLSVGVWLRGDALRVLVWRMVEQSATVVTAPLLVSESVAGRAAELWQMVGLGAEGVALMDGDAVLSLGGFASVAPKGCVKALRHRGAVVTHLAVAVGRNKQYSSVLPIGVGVWFLLCAGVLLLVFAPAEYSDIVIGAIVLVVLGGVCLAVLARGFGREAGSPSRWRWVWLSIFVVWLGKKSVSK